MEAQPTTHGPEVKLWENKQGLSMETVVYRNGEFARINWGPRSRVSSVGEVQKVTEFWVSELKDGIWPNNRPATSQEIEDFALAALDEQLSSEMAHKMAEAAVTQIKDSASRTLQRATRIETKLGLRD